MNNNYYDKRKKYAISESIWENSYDQGVMDTGIQKLKYHWVDVYLSIRIKVNGDNIEIFCTMVAYKFEVMHDEDDKIHLLPIIQKSYAYPR